MTVLTVMMLMLLVSIALMVYALSVLGAPVIGFLTAFVGGSAWIYMANGLRSHDWAAEMKEP